MKFLILNIIFYNYFKKNILYIIFFMKQAYKNILFIFFLSISAFGVNFIYDSPAILKP